MRLHDSSETTEVAPTHPLRARVEQLIRDAYARRYNATVQFLPDRLVAVLDPDGTPRAACGIRDAGTGFFSECYLDQPVERQISQHCLHPVARENVFEVVSLAGNSARAVRRLLSDVTESIRQIGPSAGVFTCPAVLTSIVARTGQPLLRLGPALRDRVERPEDWGSYYDDPPAVFAAPSRAILWGEDGVEATTTPDRARMPRQERIA